MANVKISALTAATTPDGTEVLPIVQGLATKKATVAQVRGDVAPLSNALPLGNGTANAGTGTSASRDDHVHPASSAGVLAAYLVPLSAAALGAGAAQATHWTELPAAQGTGYAIPVQFDRVQALTHIGFFVSTAGAATSVCRVGIYNDDTPNRHRCGTLVADLGTVATDTGGFKTVLTTFTPAVGVRYWILVAPQVAAGPSLRIGFSMFTFPSASDLGSPARSYANITGALASLAGVQESGSTVFPVMTFRT